MNVDYGSMENQPRCVCSTTENANGSVPLSTDSTGSDGLINTEFVVY